MNGNFVDAHGTNKSHVNFFSEHFGKIPKKFVFVKSSDKFGENLKYYMHIKEMPKHWGISCDTVEYFLRAPHASVIDVDTEGKPIYNVNHDVDTIIKRNHSVFIERLELDYKRLINLCKSSKTISFVSQYPLLRPRVLVGEDPLILTKKDPLNGLSAGISECNRPIEVRYTA